MSNHTARRVEEVHNARHEVHHTMHDTKYITAGSTLVLKVLSNLTVCCKTCGTFVKASELETHDSSQCQQGGLSLADVTLQDLLTKPSTSPLSPLEQQVGSSLIQRMETDGVVEVRRGGQVRMTYFYTCQCTCITRLCTCSSPTCIYMYIHLALGVHASDLSSQAQY